MKRTWLLAATLLLATICYTPANAQDDNSEYESIARSLLQRDDALERIEQGRPKPTLDLLFDQYAQTVWDLNAAESFAYLPKGGHIAAAALPDDVLLTWKARWGDDPRWWELRYFSAVTRQFWMKDESVDPVAIMQEALDRGLASPALIQRLYCAKAEKLLVREEYAENRWHPVWSSTDRAELHDLLEAFNKLSPDHEWGHFEAGMLHLSAGNVDEAVASFTKCNAASDRELLHIFPVDKVHAGMRSGVIVGSPVLAGMILTIPTFNPAGRWFGFHASKTMPWAAASLVDDMDLSSIQVMHEALIQNARCSKWQPISYSQLFNAINQICEECLVVYPERFPRESRRNIWLMSLRMVRYKEDNLNHRTVIYEFGNDALSDYLLPVKPADGMNDIGALLEAEMSKPGSFGDAMIERGMGHYYFEKKAEAYLEYWGSSEEQEFIEYAEQTLLDWDWTIQDFKPKEVSPEMQKLLNQMEQQIQEEERQAEQ